MGDIPCDPSLVCIQSEAMFYVVPVATNVKTMIYMGLRVTSGCRTASSRFCNSVQILFIYMRIS
eukprot:4180925-Pleurochrysis_carterae.AAC.1